MKKTGKEEELNYTLPLPSLLPRSILTFLRGG